MRIIIQSESDVIDLFKELELLTNAAKVTLSSIVVDESSSEVIIPLKRMTYKRKRYLFFGERYELVSSDLIDSDLIIRNFISLQRKNNISLQDIHLLFGIAIKNKEIHLCSVEEQAGVVAFELSIKVQTYDIELRDKKKSI